jgi:hypothetical protein
MKMINLNPSKSDLIDFIIEAKFKDASIGQKIIGFHQGMFFDINDEVTEKSIISIEKPISISKISEVLVIKDKKPTWVAPNDFKEIVKKVEKVK